MNKALLFIALVFAILGAVFLFTGMGGQAGIACLVIAVILTIVGLLINRV